MATYYEKLHALAGANKPDLPIKNTSTWIAILLHTIDDLDDVTTDKDFLWIKCHNRITMKTIKYNYWSRYPVEELKLKYNKSFPKPRATVGELLKQQKQDQSRLDKKHSNIIVLRALEPEGENASNQLVQDHALTDEIRTAIERDGHGTARAEKKQEEAIVLSDSEDEDEHKHTESGTARSSGAVSPNTSQSDANVVEYRGLGAYTSGITIQEDSKTQQVDSPLQSEHGEVYEEAAEEVESPGGDSDGPDPASDEVLPDADVVTEMSDSVTHTDHTPDDHELLIQAGELDPANYQLMLESGQISHDASPSEQAQEPVDSHVSNETTTHAANDARPTPSQSQPQFQPTFISYLALHPGVQANVKAGDWYNCASPFCQRQMVVKPWTRYHYSTGAPLCTQCTRVLLSDATLNQDLQALAKLEAQVQAEIAQKEQRQVRGIAQSPAEDAPFDWYGALRGPAMPPQWSQPTVPVVALTASPLQNMQSPMQTTGYTGSVLPTSNHAQTITPGAGASETVATSSANNKPGFFSSMFGRIKKSISPKSQASAERTSLQSPVHTTQAHGAFVSALAQSHPQSVTNTSLINNPLLPAFNAGTNGLQTFAEDNYDINDLIDDDSPFADPNAVRRPANNAAYGPLTNTGAVMDDPQDINQAAHGGSYDFAESEEEGGDEMEQDEDDGGELEEDEENEEVEEEVVVEEAPQKKAAKNKAAGKRRAAKDDDSDDEYVDEQDSDY